MLADCEISNSGQSVESVIVIGLCWTRVLHYTVRVNILASVTHNLLQTSYTYNTISVSYTHLLLF